ncbi:MAG TPA: PEP_CTERM-anchored TLD domain-containing protein [Opitutaceae bacterium]|nr:PEP_CTERM-anchored TLD domain-containing protein [Opitutaceae bacterium]
MKFVLPCFSLSILGLTAPIAHAQLLNGASEAQLVTWINQGPLTFTPDFTKIAGDGQDALDFHAASDGKGPNISLFDVTPFNVADGLYDLPEQVIAGGIPTSWYSSNTWNVVLDPTDQSAMLFNLTAGVVHHENAFTFSGIFQSFNSPSLGPTFGLGDLVTGFDLEHGTAIHYSYGGTSPLTPNILGLVGVGPSDLFRINRLEVYSVSLASIPEPVTYGLTIGTATMMFVLLRRRCGSRTALRT